jgi:hypothetical protein
MCPHYKEAQLEVNLFSTCFPRHGAFAKDHDL